MDIPFLEIMLNAVFVNTPELELLADWLFKSILVALFIWMLIAALSHKLASSSSHMLWLNIFVCTALIPLFTILPGSGSIISGSTSVLFKVVVNANAGNSLTVYPDRVFNLGTIILATYLLSVGLLLSKLTASAIRTYLIGYRGQKIDNPTLQQKVLELCSRMRISRDVQLKYTKEIATPVSFGLIKPLILLPVAARDWKPDMLADVLTHELSHIKRLDWLSMIFAYLVTSFFWLNPLLWIAQRKLIEEAENSCDSSVLRYGQSEMNYADHLLQLARSMRENPSNQLLVQMMIGKSILPNRIRRLLENDMVKAHTHPLFALPLIVLTSSLLIACSNTTLMGVESASRPAPSPNRAFRESILPVSSIAPQYPLRAAYGGIEGWALTEFTVLENGDVDADSVVVIDAEPAEIFNRASIRAAEKFKFEPISGTERKNISGVQYLFRFELGEPKEGEGSINRTLQPINSVTPEFPNQAASEGVAGGNVWTVFHVTREGTVQDVMVNYSSNDIFNESAIAAAQQLQFSPRSSGDGIEGNVRGDTTGLVRAQYLFRFDR